MQMRMRFQWTFLSASPIDPSFGAVRWPAEFRKLNRSTGVLIELREDLADALYIQCQPKINGTWHLFSFEHSGREIREKIRRFFGFIFFHIVILGVMGI